MTAMDVLEFRYIKEPDPKRETWTNQAKQVPAARFDPPPTTLFRVKRILALTIEEDGSWRSEIPPRTAGTQFDITIVNGEESRRGEV